MDAKSNILKGLSHVIWTITNAEYQERVWINGLGPECGSFEETICNFFDDYNAEEILNNYKDYNITFKQYQILLKLYKLLDKYSDEAMSYSDFINPEVIIKDKKWKKIQKLAKEVLKAFNYKKKATKK